MSASLHQSLANHFSEEDLKTLCFDLSVDYENMPAQGKAGKARELVLHLYRAGRISELVAQCRSLRPNADWDYTPKTVAFSLGDTGDRNRWAMLQLVHTFWVKGVLEQSLHGAAVIALDIYFTLGQKQGLDLEAVH